MFHSSGAPCLVYQLHPYLLTTLYHSQPITLLVDVDLVVPSGENIDICNTHFNVLALKGYIDKYSFSTQSIICNRFSCGHT